MKTFCKQTWNILEMSQFDLYSPDLPTLWAPSSRMFTSTLCWFPSIASIRLFSCTTIRNQFRFADNGCQRSGGAASDRRLMYPVWAGLWSCESQPTVWLQPVLGGGSYLESYYSSNEADMSIFVYVLVSVSFWGYFRAFTNCGNIFAPLCIGGWGWEWGGGDIMTSLCCLRPFCLYTIWPVLKWGDIEGVSLSHFSVIGTFLHHVKICRDLCSWVRLSGERLYVLQRVRRVNDELCFWASLAPPAGSQLNNLVLPVFLQQLIIIFLNKPFNLISKGD